jgi:hypothetical protein
LITDSIDRSINFISAIGFHDEIHGVTLGEVDRRATNLFSRLKTLGNTVHDEHSRGATQDGRVCCHETYRASTEDSDALARSETRNFNTMPAGREDISKKNEIRLMLFPSREFKSIKISVRNSNVLSLTTSVRAHSNVAIGTSSKSRVYASAESSLALFAIAAAAVSDVEGHNDAVPFLKESYSLAELFYYSHILMAWQV